MEELEEMDNEELDNEDMDNEDFQEDTFEGLVEQQRFYSHVNDALNDNVSREARVLSLHRYWWHCKSDRCRASYMYEKMQRSCLQDMTVDRGHSPVLLLALMINQKVENPLEGFLEEFHVQQVTELKNLSDPSACQNLPYRNPQRSTGGINETICCHWKTFN